jgi:hypothetical protein
VTHGEDNAVHRPPPARVDRALPAISLHVYYPGADLDDPLRTRRRDAADAGGRAAGGGLVTVTPPAPPGSRGIAEILTAARRRLYRLTPAGAYAVRRNHLEWRFDPRCDARLSIVDRYDLSVVVFCSEGYTCSLGAAALQELGLWRATDLAGRFRAWAAAGLPVESVA